MRSMSDLLYGFASTFPFGEVRDEMVPKANPPTPTPAEASDDRLFEPLMTKPAHSPAMLSRFHDR
jgi:hypothetical protein